MTPEARAKIMEAMFAGLKRNQAATSPETAVPDSAADEVRRLTGSAIRRAAEELRKSGDTSDLFGFALCTDDDVRSVYHVASTREWVRQEEAHYPGIGFIYVEWVHSANEQLFDAVSSALGTHADQDYGSAAGGNAARDRRFQSLVLALKDCRDEGVFDENTFLCVGSTDPSEHLESLAMKGVDLINPKILADQFANALEYGKYRG